MKKKNLITLTKRRIFFYQLEMHKHEDKQFYKIKITINFCNLTIELSNLITKIMIYLIKNISSNLKVNKEHLTLY